eukprot:237122-Hanusia_phi.AAC.2
MAEHGVVLQNMFRGQANLLRTYQTVFPSVLLADTGSSSKGTQPCDDADELGAGDLLLCPPTVPDALTSACTLTQQSSVTDASEPLLAIEPIFDNNTEVVELEQQRWGKS